MRKKNKLVYGVGINDADYAVYLRINGKIVVCRFYRVWKDMLARCYDDKRQSRHPTYIGCTVCDEWHIFSNFKRWMEKQDWQGKELDKDILYQGNKVYSAKSCRFVDKLTNGFLNDHNAARGDWPIGAHLRKDGKFQSQCSNPFSRKREFLGYFTCQRRAHEAWRRRKHELACQLADLQTDERVALALKSWYL